ncbi:hypothetical protein L6164_028508 [Bauhinia variegata]|uniref:Uncharacterized protein n=1 Tax=Bauhinia variegata TaxID=167791 RepID=A0ACB9L6Q7_BAUVA|nr:hypothetical protein L6164_028508 [Bauhinia variegata]
MATGKTSHRGIKICLGVSALLTLIFTTVIVTLIFTIFKPKDPIITIHPVDIENINQLSFGSNVTINVTLDMDITVQNPNYASFRCHNSTGYVNYHDIVVAEVPMKAQLIPARSKINLTTSADFMVGKLIEDPNFWLDFANGTLNFTSMATLPGKMTMLKIIKFKGTVNNWCDISVNISSKAVESKCLSKIKL